MFPNINVDDRVLVVKDEIINYEYNLGDIVVFYAPQSPIPLSTDLLISNLKIWNLITQNEVNNQGTVYIKRIVGTPGDQVNIGSNGSIFVNDIELEIQNVNNTNNGDMFEIKLSENELLLILDKFISINQLDQIPHLMANKSISLAIFSKVARVAVGRG